MTETLLSHPDGSSAPCVDAEEKNKASSNDGNHQKLADHPQPEASSDTSGHEKLQDKGDNRLQSATVTNEIPLFDVSKLYSDMGLLGGPQQRLLEERPPEPRLIYRSSLQTKRVSIPARYYPPRDAHPNPSSNIVTQYSRGPPPQETEPQHTLLHGGRSPCPYSISEATGGSHLHLGLNSSYAPPPNPTTLIKESTNAPPTWLRLDRGEIFVLDPASYTPFKLSPLYSYGLQALVHWVSMALRYCSSRQLYDPLTTQHYTWISKSRAIHGQQMYAVEELPRACPPIPPGSSKAVERVNATWTKKSSTATPGGLQQLWASIF